MESTPEAIPVDPTIAYIRPRTEEEWETWRPIFTKLYIDENRPLPEVMQIMLSKHQVNASKKIYKNKIKAWKLRKYLKKDEAQQILDGDLSATDVPDVPSLAREQPEEVRKRAERSLKRKRNRERAANQPSPTVSDSPQAIPPQTSNGIPYRPTQPGAAEPQTVELTAHQIQIREKFLFNLRAWTHEAFIFGHWDTKLSEQHHSGRQASRMLSSDLTAGTNLFEKGNRQQAWTYWNRAIESFQNPDLFKTWYHETPIHLLFEVSRVAENGHPRLAAILLISIRDWANNFLEETDSRQALFSVFGELDVCQLRDLYGRAAHCLYKGLESRLEKQNPLLYEVRLNRALDMLWYDPESDLTEWVPPIEEVDEACGPNNPYSVYFLLLKAYRLVAQESYPESEVVCTQVRTRLADMKEGDIDPWRVGLAYRRLGRQQHAKGRFKDARRSFNVALKYVGRGNRLSASILIEICQMLESMATADGDQEDAELWSQMLQQLEQKTDEPADADASRQNQQGRLLAPRDALTISKRRRLESGIGRSMTL